jgi:hypothetical protein
MVGFLQTDSGMSCAYATQVAALGEEDAIVDEVSAFIKPSRGRSVASETEVAAINELGLTWKASSYSHNE